MSFDLVSDGKESISLVAATRTTDADGSTVDLRGFKSALFVAAIGANGSIATDSLSSSIKVEIEVEESINDSDWDDVADADLVGYVAGTNDGCMVVVNEDTKTSAVYIAQYIGDKRYVRAVANFTDTPSIPVSVAVIALDPTYGPTT